MKEVYNQGNVKYTRRHFIKLGGVTTLAGLGGLGFSFAGCQEDSPVDENNNLGIRGVSIPSSLDVTAGTDITLQGTGFQAGDTIELMRSSDGVIFTVSVTAITNSSATFPVPDGITTGNYTLKVIRGENSLTLGRTLLNVVANTDVPDVAGMTVKGVVYCDGKGVGGVVVSDGYEVAVTDSKGVYYLPSLKKTGFVFISIPSNYEVVNQGNAPQFFKRVSNNTTAVDQKDFSLMKVNNEKHVVIPMADWHLANRNNDLEQFNNKVLPDVNATIEQYAADGTKVYVLTLGDMTWELYWYSNGFGLNEYIPYMNKLKSPVFNLMGNHDNDPYYANDWDAEEKYRDIIGPTYYSFNLGKIHYVVLDNVEYVNNGAAAGTIGDRSYRDRVHNDQIEWLKKDLATIPDKSTPIVLAMHTPLYANPALDGAGTQVNKVDMTNGSVLIDCFREFSTVHVLTGHTHINYTAEEKPSLLEHNIAAICATWWWTGKNGYAGNHICRDGSPGGYGIWKMNGRDINWLYKSIGYPENYQFRAYDLNAVHITAAAFAPKSTDSALAKFAGPYASQRAGNEVLLNVWGYDSQWKIAVTENGKSLPVNRVKVLDPLHIVSYEALRLNAGAEPTDAFVSTETAHMFSVTASAPDTTLEINVTDRFGNIYRESMVRPKPFVFLMK